MAEQLNLEQFRASGVYTVEIDASINLTFPITAGRLVIGSSRRGPINTVVLLRDKRTGKNVYGGRDFFLENKGSYFHKTLDVMLNEGPVYALNLMPVDLEDDRAASGSDSGHVNADKAYFTTFNSESADCNGENLYAELGYSPGLPKNSPIKNYYNRQKFWYASDLELVKTKNSTLGETSSTFGTIAAANKILSFANLSKREVTVFIKKADITGYDVTVEEWFATRGDDIQIANYLHKDDFISDYMVDVIVVEGDWTNYLKLANDPIYGRYFDVNGLIITKINDFVQLNSTTLIARANGCLIPDFQDNSDNIISIDKVFNNMYPLTEMVASLDTEKLDAIDLEEITFNADSIITQRIDFVGYGVNEIAQTADDGTNKMIDVLSYRSPLTNTFKFKETSSSTVSSIVFVDSGTSPNTVSIKAYVDSKLYKLWKSGYLANGDLSIDQSGVSPLSPDAYIKVTGPFDDTVIVPGETVKYIIINGYSDSTLLNESGLNVWDESGTDIVIFQTELSDYSKVVSLSALDSFSLEAANQLKIETTSLSASALAEMFEFIKPGTYLKAKTNAGRNRMLKILSVSSVKDSNSPTKNFYLITTMSSYENAVEGIDIGATGSEQITAYKGIYNYVTSLRGLALNNFKLREQLLPNGTGSRQTDIYKYLYDTNIAVAISQGEPLDVRHLVDSYEGEISNSSKYYIVKLGAEHAKTLVFANGPSWKQFERSTDPSFIDSYTGLVKSQYIADGGDLSLNPSYQYQLASDTIKGVPIESFAFYTVPYLLVRENGKNKTVPPAAYASNAWIRKFKTGNPYAIQAGKRGVIIEPEIIGVEYDFTDDDRAVLEPKGYNLLIRRRGIGTMLLSNNTAYQKVKSALNNAHARDVLITIEKDIEKILYNFLFDFNDGITRIRVRTLVENYLDGVLAARGIAWYEVTIDDSNNDREVLEANSAIIDVKVDFNRGIHKFINRITITRVGGELSAIQTGFSAVA